MPDQTVLRHGLPTSTYTVYIFGTLVKARNNRTSFVDFTGDNTVDAIPTIANAVNNIQNIANIGLDPNHGASVYILAGKYKCISELAVTKVDAGRVGINIVGEGSGTHLSFEPSSLLTNGVRLKMNLPRLAHLLISGNSNLVNLVKGEGPAESSPTDSQHNWGVIEHVTFCGPGSNVQEGKDATIKGGTPPETTVPGQIGLHLQGDHSETSNFTANWKVSNCEFFALDTAILLEGQFIDMSNWNNIHIGGCETGMIIEGVQHNLSNFRIEGGGGTVNESNNPLPNPGGFNLLQGAATVGSKGIWIRPPAAPFLGGNINFLSNINIELHKLDSQGILIESQCSINRMSNIFNSSGDSMSKHTVFQNHRVPVSNLPDVPDASINRTAFSNRRYGSINFGFSRRGFENGILLGNIDTLNNGTVNADLETTSFVNGPFGTLQTTTLVNDVACIYYNNPNGNHMIKDSYPNLYIRFFPNSLSNIRVFMGLWNQFAAPTGSSDLLANRRGIGLYLDTSVSNNWKIMHNDNSASSQIADFPTHTYGNLTYGPNAITSSFVQAVTISYVPSNSSNPDIQNGPTASVMHHGLAYDWKSANVPTGDNFGFLIYLENLTASASGILRLFDVELAITEL